MPGDRGDARIMVLVFWGGGSNARPGMVWAEGMLGARVYGVSLFPLDKQNVPVDGLVILRWTNRSFRDPFSSYGRLFFTCMSQDESIDGHVGHLCLLLDILNLPWGPHLPVQSSSPVHRYTWHTARICRMYPLSLIFPGLLSSIHKTTALNVFFDAID